MKQTCKPLISAPVSSQLKALAGFTLMLALSGVPSCTDTKLERVPPTPVYRDDKIEIQGALCTRSPETLVFPLRVLFVVDASVSMAVSDPPDPVTGITGRENAVREVWSDLLDQGPEGVKIGIIRFSSQAQSRTAVDLDGDGLPDTYFTADRNLLDVATQALRATDRTTNYANALGEAYYEIRNELSQASQESLPLSKYVVVFISDGVPDTDNLEERGNATEDILEAVRNLQDLADNFRVGSFELHTAFLSSSTIQAFDQEAEDLLSRMAREGEGNFRSFRAGEELNFLFVDFTIVKRIFTLKSVLAVNENVVLDINQMPAPPPPPEELEEDEELEPEPDIVDEGGETEDLSELETELSEEPSLNPMSYVDVNKSGWVECGEAMSDSDADGLSDLMELELGTDPLLRDTDDDGLNDFLEWQYRKSGLDPLELNESCYIPNVCLDADEDGFCDCTLDLDLDGRCDCVDNVDEPCLDELGHDCLDADEDGFCDCPDRNADGRCDYSDTDGDGLHDCEELLYGTAQRGADSDADGVPDPVEVRFGTNPGERDHARDSDFDRISNANEINAGTNPLCDDNELRPRVAYRYQLLETGLKTNQSCYQFGISNITLVPTLARESSEVFPGNGMNRIMVYAGEVAFDDPNSFAAYRVACVLAAYQPEGGYKNPPSGLVKLTEEDFVPVDQFNPLTHCKAP
ncbi:MAG: VWA domain-containing protein [Myxococcota bacterium]|jgi:hypothetical protein|nr:VWA domain-containing protein [Myxococcota bacterium]